MVKSDTKSKSSAANAAPPPPPPSDHHYDENGELVRSDVQKKLIADLEAIVHPSQLNRRPKGDEDGRTLARFCRAPPSFTAHAQKLHEKQLEQTAAFDEQISQSPQLRARFAKRKIVKKRKPRPAPKIAVAKANPTALPPTMPPPAPRRS